MRVLASMKKALVLTSPWCNYLHKLWNCLFDIARAGRSRLPRDHETSHDYGSHDRPGPARAARNVFTVLKEGGYFIIATPFLIRVHESPIDCTRWTKDGLFYFSVRAQTD
jgi:hypothetical protein